MNTYPITVFVRTESDVPFDELQRIADRICHAANHMNGEVGLSDDESDTIVVGVAARPWQE